MTHGAAGWSDDGVTALQRGEVTVFMRGARGHSAALIGERSLLIRCADVLTDHGIEISVIATNAEDIGQWCTQTDTARVDSGPGLTDRLAPYEFDYLFSITNLSVLPAEVLEMAGTMAINFHDGPLPAYAGLHATTWALLAGERSHGVSWHVMEPAVDRGDLLKQSIFDVAADATAQSLNIACYEHAVSTFEELVADIVGDRVERQVQDDAGRSYFGRKRRPAAAGTIVWSDPVAAIDRLVRALDFGLYENPLARAKVLIGERLFAVDRLDVVEEPAGASPGTILSVDGASITVAAADGRVAVHEISSSDRGQHTPAGAIAEAGLSVGDRLAVVPTDQAEQLATLAGEAALSEARWVSALENLEAVELPSYRRQDGSENRSVSVRPIELPAGTRTAGDLVGAFAGFLSRLCGAPTLDLALVTGGAAEHRPWFSSQVPLRCQIGQGATAGEVLDAVSADLAGIDAQATFATDLPLRYPELQSLAMTAAAAALPLPVGVAVGGSVDQVDTSAQDVILHVDLGSDDAGTVANLVIADAAFSPTAADRLVQRASAFMAAAIAEPTRPLADLPVLTEDEYRTVVSTWNDTAGPKPTSPVPELFRATARRKPEAIAVVDSRLSLTYAELDQRSDALAARLRELGVSPNDRVGIMVDRGAPMVVGLLGILKAAGAYVPLDPSYPADRLQFMAEDAEFPVLVVDENTAAQAPATDGEVLVIDAGGAPTTPASTSEPGGPVDLDDLAYVIYTSGSTGRPKGVMVTHRNLVSFLDGMDRHIEHEEDSTWLTVTSLSFDISLLEIFWSLTRGLELVIHDPELEAKAAPTEASPTPPPGAEALGFSLFYFASDESDAGSDNKYRLLLEGARFADDHGFEAVWTPERHFHAFGGLYPNPAVTGAAIAAATTNVDIRAGSCVIPLHHPIRVAEEWSMVDNLSNGRAGVAFASGWQPDDFVLRPENFAERKEAMLRDIEVVRQLWRGEELTFEGPRGPSTTRILPRPVQPELPTWITAAGNPATYEAAGAGGHNILTHLLGQSVDEVEQKIEIYRKARAAAGHDGPGHVTLMLHTHLGTDMDTVKEQVRPGMKEYLRSSVDLIKEAAWSFPTFKEQEAKTGTNPVTDFDANGLSDEEMEALLEHAFERYFTGSALFGTVESCTEVAMRLQSIGVDEIACQIDFGLPTDEVMAALPLLDQVRRNLAAWVDTSTAAPATPVDHSIPGLIERHDVTHFQCTPSMGAMLVANDDFRRVAPRLKLWLMGGEAFPQALAEQARELVDHDLVNVYGPTETTIWSSAYPVTDASKPVTIGRPLTNQQMYVVDADLQPCPIGKPGELLIGGDGVTNGYLGREQLTAEKFIPDHFRPDVPGARLYRTGDLVRHDDDGQLVFLGRMDLQVKVRGYRIELGEIETLLQQHPSVRDAVVMAREDRPGDQQLIGYVTADGGSTIDPTALRRHLERSLPTFMVPSRIVTMERFPLTPNKKTDRLALPPPTAENTGSGRRSAPAPTEGTEGALAKIWQDLLSLDQVGVEDNFFDLGGHSLLAVQLNRMIEQELGTELSITEVFRFPTVAALAARLDGSNGSSEAPSEQSVARADNRRRALASRRRPSRG